MICNSDATVTIRYLLINHGLLASLDSSHDLQHICAKSFVNRLHLLLQISKIPSEIFFATELNTASNKNPKFALGLNQQDAPPDLMN